MKKLVQILELPINYLEWAASTSQKCDLDSCERSYEKSEKNIDAAGANARSGFVEIRVANLVGLLQLYCARCGYAYGHGENDIGRLYMNRAGVTVSRLTSLKEHVHRPRLLAKMQAVFTAHSVMRDSLRQLGF
jgi:hypothetical protein